MYSFFSTSCVRDAHFTSEAFQELEKKSRNSPPVTGNKIRAHLECRLLIEALEAKRSSSCPFVPDEPGLPRIVAPVHYR